MQFSGYSQFMSDDYNNPCLTDKTVRGSNLYYCTESNLMPIEFGSDMAQAAGPIPVNFPDPDPNWFFDGYPEFVKAGSANGSPVDYIPVSFYAKKNGKITIAFDEIDIYVGYLNTQGKYVKTIQIDSNFNQGDFVFAILLSKYAGAARYTMIRDTSYWGLLSEVSNIQPNQTVTKAVTITSGVTTEESRELSSTIGATVGFKAGISGAEISASLSASLTQSFESSVAITMEITVTDTVTFAPQKREQRAAIYQFAANYEIVPASPLMGWRDYLNGTSTDEARFFSSQLVCNVDQAPPFTYPSRYFATSFVVEPQ